MIEEKKYIIPPGIDNEKYFMKDALRNIFSKWATHAKIAVGWFFVTAFDNIKDNLKNVEKIQVIMGHKTNKKTREELALGTDAHAKIESGTSKEVVMQYVNEYIKEINSEDELVRLDALVKKMIDGIIEVRIRVLDKGIFHSKLYWFKCEERGSDIVIIGSHNMSKSAQEDNEEISAIIDGRLSTDYWEAYFDRKWEQSKPFTRDLIKLISFTKKYRKYKHKKKHEAREKKKEEQLIYTYQYLPPIEYFKTLIKSLRKEYLLETDDILIPFQKIDYNLCRHTIQKYGGVILANTVGLGKSYIAARLVKDYLKRGERYLFIVPPNTMDQWIDYLNLFNIPVEEGKTLISMYAVSQKTFPTDTFNDFDIIVVDESHNFRNQESNRWKNFMIRIKNSSADYVLLTATPINNRLSDLRAQVSMFQNERFRNENLNIFYKALCDYDDKSDKDQSNLLQKIKKLRKEIIVRTTRNDLKELYEEIIIPGKGVVEIHDPEVKQEIYELTGEDYKELFQTFVPRFIEPLRLPHITILNPKAGTSIHGLFKILLYKRLESSIYALYKSVLSLERKNFALAALLEHRTIEEIRDLEKKEYTDLLRQGADVDESDVLNFLYDDEKNIDNQEKEMYLHNIQHDLDIIAMFKSTLEQLKKADYRFHDDKLDTLKQLMTKYHERKIIIFTQFSDTAKYIYDNVRERASETLLIRLVSGQTKNKIVEAMQFSPSSYREKMKREVEKKYRVTLKPPYTKILITTDTFSEGVNLTEADVVINYDLPWNPVKIVQRVGRANRIGRTEGVKVINFLPDKKIDKEMQLLKKLKKKIGNIIEIIGSEHSILSPEEVTLIRQKKVNDLELFKAKRELVRTLQIDQIEKTDERTKLSALEKFLLTVINQNAIKLQDLEHIELTEEIFYTILPYREKATCYIYKIEAGDDSYHKHTCLTSEKRSRKTLPTPDSFISPRTRLLQYDLTQVEKFREGQLQKIENERKSAQSASLDQKTNRAKERLVAKLRSILRRLVMQLKKNRELRETLDKLVNRLDHLNPPPTHKNLITKFEAKWTNNNEYLAKMKVFLQELEKVVSDLEVVSGSVLSTKFIKSELTSFLLYDNVWKEAKKKEK